MFRLLTACFVLALCASLFPAAALEGVIQLNQTCATNGGCTATDTTGFPITIDQPGSYRLTSNLDVPDSQHGILIQTDRVHIDLNGHAINGTGVGTVEGIRAVTFDNITVIDGVVRNMGGTGVEVVGQGNRVEGVHAIGNGGSGSGGNGIVVGPGSLVLNCTAVDNLASGIYARNGSVVIGNVSRGNTTGLFCDDNPGGTGSTAYGNNALSNNSSVNVNGICVDTDGNVQ